MRYIYINNQLDFFQSILNSYNKNALKVHELLANVILCQPKKLLDKPSRSLIIRGHTLIKPGSNRPDLKPDDY